MRVIEISDDDAALLTLKPTWEALLGSSASATVFLTWEWITAWWKSYGTPGELRVFVASDDHGTVRGIAPMRSKTVRRYGQSVRALCFAGDGSNDSEYLDVIAARGFEQEVIEAFWNQWQPELQAGTVLLLNDVPECSPNRTLLKSLAGRQDTLCMDTSVSCGILHLPPTWDEYLGTLKPRFRTKVRSVLRNVEGRPDVRFGFCERREDIELLLPVLFDLHTRRWAVEAQPGVFRWNRKRDFYAALTPLLLDNGWLRFSWLEWNGYILACQYGFVYGDTYFHLQEGYEPAAEHWNVGAALRAWSIREFLKQGLRNYDFLGGVGRHKADWGAETKHSFHTVIARSTYRNLLFCHGPEWETRTRESVGRLVPGRIMAARRALLQRRSSGGFQPALNGDEPNVSKFDWLRQATANCYYRLQGPALIRRVRERYQLSGLSWRKRTEPVARILYYHRINDENDPFFPAMAAEAFDQQMRFIAKHYNVVSLTSLLDRLQAGCPEPVLAITFDDGYEDNYTSALPILQRYGLPATIFLTTGSMDSGEPLWFEQLADTIARTAKELIDLEIDIPRRFWLRTLPERLKSHDRIFELLRRCPDSVRRYWLAYIAAQLGVPSNGVRKSRMLTWDQVRHMNAQNIDFGGHTVNHPFLSQLTRAEAAWEVSECKRRIEEELQGYVEHFAYPNGREEDIGGYTKEAIRAAGYRAAVTTIWGVNDRSTDLMELRRGQPWEQTPAMFASKLDWYELMKK